NPAIMMKQKVAVALPGAYINGTHTGFSMNDLLSTNDAGENQLSLEAALEQMQGAHYVRAQTEIEPLAIGLRFNKFQLGVSYRFLTDVFLAYPTELPVLGWEGNASFVGEKVDISPRLSASAWHEMAVGTAVKLPGDNLTLGIRAKYLKGVANLSSGAGSLSLRTSEDMYHLQVEVDQQLRATGIILPDSLETVGDWNPEVDLDPMAANHGFAMDIGVVYEISDRMQFSASVLDLGNIWWTEGSNRLSATGDFTFEGLDIGDLIENDSAAIEQFTDSLENSLSLASRDANYLSGTPTKLLLSARFTPVKHLHLQGMVYSEWLQGITMPGIAFNLTKEFGKTLVLGATYSVRNRQEDNLGASIRLKAGPCHWFLITDNLLDYVMPLKAQNPNIRFGMNLMFGRRE
ncbi:MAG: DUF5723 family protein, partial [Bacteroidota bacterium]